MLQKIKKYLLSIVDDIDAGNSNIDEEEAMRVVRLLIEVSRKDTPMSKYQAYTYLNISRATFDNPLDHIALVLVGPTSNGEEFIDSLVHEVHHLAVFIATELGIDLESETPAYISGDSARDLARVICKLGCPHCSSD